MHKVFNDPLLAMEPPIALVTLRRQDGSEALLRTSAAPLLANLDGEHEANAGPGEYYKVSAPIIKTAAQKADEDSFIPPTWRETLTVAGTPIAIFLIVLAVWAYRTWGA